MKVVVDTSELFPDPVLSGLPMRTLLERARIGGLTLVVPEVVVLELVNHVRERIEQATDKMMRGRWSLLRFGLDVEPITLDPAELTSVFEQHLRDQITGVGGQIPPIPDIAHRDLVIRSAEGVKPFRTSGVGYRDALIWHTVLREAVDDDVVFLSSNTGDFADDDGTALHSDLTAEMAALGLSGQVTLVTKLDAFIAAYVPIDVQALAEARKRYEEEPSFAMELREETAEMLLRYEAWDHGEVDFVGLRAPAMRGEHTPESIMVDALDVISIEFDQAYEFDPDDQTGLLELTVAAEVAVELLFHKADAEWLIERGAAASIHDFDWNETMAAASNTVYVRVRCNALFDRASKSISDLSVMWIEDLPMDDPSHPASRP